VQVESLRTAWRCSAAECVTGRHDGGVILDGVYLVFPNIQPLSGASPTVVIGPNGSGKTRQTRDVRWRWAQDPPGLEPTFTPEFINAARISSAQASGPTTLQIANGQFAQAKQDSLANYHYPADQTTHMLSMLNAEHSEAANLFMRAHEDNPSGPHEVPATRLRTLERIWGEIFPGRALSLVDWTPVVSNTSTGTIVEYQASMMSDGERTALELIGRVLTAEPGALVVDEPEIHLHTQLAVRLWNVLETQRPDLAFVYVTHDLSFALSRKTANYVIADPVSGLRLIDVPDDLPRVVSEALLGSASLSFFASRIVFCEGDSSSLDTSLYEAWFSGADTVVRAVGGCETVLRCVSALSETNIAAGLSVTGIVDRDFLPDAFLAALPHGVATHGLHEVESLFCHPDVVAAVCAYLNAPYEPDSYLSNLKRTVRPEQAEFVILDRWKRRLEPQLVGLVASVKKVYRTSAALGAAIPQVFDPASWPFDANDILLAEETTVRDALASEDTLEFLRVFPGKQMLNVAAAVTGTTASRYVSIVLEGLRSDGGKMETLRLQLEQAFGQVLPERHKGLI
jgi:hypothetical protein